jgi:hypothetical protein
MQRFVLLLAAALPLLPLAGRAQTAPPATTAPTATAPDDTAGGHHKLQQKFNAANTTHDGHLTLAQAKAAGMAEVVTDFSAIDTSNRGYVTLNDVMAWHLEQKAKQMEQQAATLRATD